MYVVLTEESLTRLSSNTESTMDAKDSPCVRAHAYKFFENGIANEGIVPQ